MIYTEVLSLFKLPYERNYQVCYERNYQVCQDKCRMNLLTHIRSYQSSWFYFVYEAPQQVAVLALTQKPYMSAVHGSTFPVSDKTDRAGEKPLMHEHML